MNVFLGVSPKPKRTSDIKLQQEIGERVWNCGVTELTRKLSLVKPTSRCPRGERTLGGQPTAGLVLSPLQGSQVQLALQLLGSQGTLDGLAARVEHGVRALLPLRLLLGASCSHIHPVEEGQDKIGQAKFQLHKQSQQDQPEEHLQEGDVGQERLVLRGRGRRTLGWIPRWL